MTTTVPQFISVPKDGNPVIIATDQIVNVFVDREDRTVIALKGDKFSHTDAFASEVAYALCAFRVETENP